MSHHDMSHVIATPSTFVGTAIDSVNNLLTLPCCNNVGKCSVIVTKSFRMKYDDCALKQRDNLLEYTIFDIASLLSDGLYCPRSSM